jgi:HEAT repeat protein
LLDLLDDQRTRPLALEAFARVGLSGQRQLTAIVGGAQTSQRCRAADALGAIKAPWAVEVLRNALVDAAPAVRSHAAMALAALGQPPTGDDPLALTFAIAARRWDDIVAFGERAVGPLVEAFPPQSFQPRDFVRALGRIGGARAAGALATLLEGAKDYERNEILTALVDLRDSRALAALQAILRAPDAGAAGTSRHQMELAKTLAVAGLRARLDAVKLLQRFGGAEAIAVLVDALANPHRGVRRAAADALDASGWQPDSAHEVASRLIARTDWVGVVALGGAAAPALAPAVADEDFATSFAAAEALAAIGEAKTVPPPLLRGLEHADYRIRVRAVEVLGKVSDPHVLDILGAALGTSFIDRHAADALVACGAPAVGVLIAALPRAPGVAAGALGRLGDPRAVEPLIDALAKASENGRESIAGALGQLGDPRAVGPLLAVLPAHASASETLAIRGAMAALRRLAPANVEQLVAALEEPGTPLWALALLLGECRETRAVERVVAAVPEAADPDLACFAQGLAAIGDRRAVPPLAARLEPRGSGVVAAALASFGDWRSLDALREYARRQDGTCVDTYRSGTSSLEPALEALVRTLRASAADAPDEVLQPLAALKDMSESVSSVVNACSRVTETHGVSCAHIRQLARQELIRRGASATASGHA